MSNEPIGEEMAKKILESFKTVFNELPEEEQRNILKGIEETVETVRGVATKVLESSNTTSVKDEMKDAIHAMAQIAEYYEENKEIFDKEDEWETITGFSTKELSEMQVWEIVELIKAEPIKATKKKGRPKKAGDVHRFIPRLATITNKEYACALSPNIGGPAYIAVLDEEFFKQTGFDEADGALTVKDRPDIKIPLQDLRTKEDIKSLDYTLLRSIYTLLYQQQEDLSLPGNFVIDEMELARFLGIQINKGNAYPLLAKINQFNSVAGVINGSIYSLLHLNSYDKDTGKISLYSGFMGILDKAIKLSSTRTKKIKGIQETYENPNHSFLMHSNVGAKCKNVNGILLAERIIVLLQQAGEKINPHIKFSTLIDSVPTLKQTLDETQLAKDRNIVLKRAFTAAYKVLKNNTDVYSYFDKLNIPEIIPTSSVLDTVLTLTHEGIKKDYKTPASI